MGLALNQTIAMKPKSEKPALRILLAYTAAQDYGTGILHLKEGVLMRIPNNECDGFYDVYAELRDEKRSTYTKLPRE